MTLFAFLLIVAAAFIHASWNLLYKQVGGGVPLLWLFTTISVVAYLPLAVYILWSQHPPIGPMQILFLVGTSLIHIVYFVTLQRGYRVGDLSVVYPLARGTGPTLSTIIAIVFLGERPSLLALIGALLVIGGVFVIASGGNKDKANQGNLRKAVGYGLFIGVLIACYTIWDRTAVAYYAIPPLILDYGSQLARMVFLAPVALRRSSEVAYHWRTHRWQSIGIALLNPLSYILVLTAMQTTLVSHVAPARELSILIGALMGAQLLKEGNVGRRLAAAAAIVAGVVALALG